MCSIIYYLSFTNLAVRQESCKLTKRLHFLEVALLWRVQTHVVSAKELWTKSQILQTPVEHREQQLEALLTNAISLISRLGKDS